MSRTAWLVTFLISFVLFGCLCAACLLAWVTYTAAQSPEIREVVETIAATPIPSPVPEIIVTPPPVEVFDTLETLRRMEVPLSDLRGLAERLKGIENIPLVVAVNAATLPLGAVKTFNASNVDTNEHYTVQAELVYLTDHVYFWVGQAAPYAENEVRLLVDRFETRSYPTDREFFGSEWTPGVDGDPHLHILLARGLGGSVAGYYSSVDEYSRLAHEFSNEVEIFYLNADNINLDSEFTDGVLAHEFQHMIHWFQDRNEETWMNEGFSEVAAFINGYDPGGFDFLYASEPDQQLNSWPGGPGGSGAHYGQSFLFLTYFLGRFGSDVTRAVVSQQENGLDSIDLVLQEQGIADPISGLSVTADDVFADWSAALYLRDTALADGRYGYQNYDSAPSPELAESIEACPVPSTERTVTQYGVDYIGIRCQGTVTLRFTGSQQVRVIPPEPPVGEGSLYVWSNRGDDSNMTLTRAFDLRDAIAPINLSYQTWYDIEEGYDYVYLEVSSDGGRRWTILNTPSGTSEDPSGNSFGWGYNHFSGGGSAPEWITERVDLSQYAGSEILVRFEYVTDAAVNGAGMVLDNLAIPELNYREDFENGEGGWEFAGWVRIENRLPQTFRVQVIEQGAQTRVVPLPLDEFQRGEYTLTLGGDVEEAVVIVSGTARFSQEVASYKYEIVQN